MTAAEVQAALADFFPPDEVKWLPKVVKGNSALGMPYIDARLVQDRLDDVVGADGWQDQYEMMPDGVMVCTLKVRIAGQWVQKQDVGSPSEQPDGGDRVKAAVSDALKRAAVKFGVGRYLYRLPPQWADFDPVKKKFTQTPKLPAWARPQSAGRVTQSQPAKPADPKPAAPAAAGNLPATGQAFADRLIKTDDQMVAQGLASPNELAEHVYARMRELGHGDEYEQWGQAEIAVAVAEAQKFKAFRRKATA